MHDPDGQTPPKRRALILSLALCAIILLLLSLGTPWYTAGMERPEETMERAYTFSGVGTKLDTETPNGTSSVSSFIEWGRMEWSEAARAVMQLSLCLMFGALLLALLFAPATLLLKSLRRRKLALLLASFASILCLLAPVLFAALLPGAFNADGAVPTGMRESFWGSSATSGKRESWGPGGGWALALLALPFLASDAVLLAEGEISRGLFRRIRDGVAGLRVRTGTAHAERQTLAAPAPKDAGAYEGAAIEEARAQPAPQPPPGPELSWEPERTAPAQEPPGPAASVPGQPPPSDREPSAGREEGGGSDGIKK